MELSKKKSERKEFYKEKISGKNKENQEIFCKLKNMYKTFFFKVPRVIYSHWFF